MNKDELKQRMIDSGIPEDVAEKRSVEAVKDFEEYRKVEEENSKHPVLNQDYQAGFGSSLAAFFLQDESPTEIKSKIIEIGDLKEFKTESGSNFLLGAARGVWEISKIIRTRFENDRLTELLLENENTHSFSFTDEEKKVVH